MLSPKYEESAVVTRAPGSNPGICGLSLWLVRSLALRDFSPGTPVFPSPQ